VRAALAEARHRLTDPSSAARTQTPALDAEVLLRHVLRVDRTALLAHPDRTLTPAQRRRYGDLIGRRGAGEPVAYLTGHREFMGHDFSVDRRVLVPRPETELLVERTLAHLPPGAAGLRAADVGTGSGAIAVSLALARPGLAVVATDTSPEALSVAKKNARRILGSGWPRRLRFRLGNLLAPVRGSVDVIAANLPYITSAEMVALPVSVRDYEPAGALDGGPDGLDAYRGLLQQAPAKLKPGGALLMECDPRQARQLARLARAAFPAGTVSVLRDLAGRERIVEVATGG
jgi:release factor glutamine methyltransferase